MWLRYSLICPVLGAMCSATPIALEWKPLPYPQDEGQVIKTLGSACTMTYGKLLQPRITHYSYGAWHFSSLYFSVCFLKKGQSQKSLNHDKDAGQEALLLQTLFKTDHKYYVKWVHTEHVLSWSPWNKHSVQTISLLQQHIFMKKICYD